MTAAAFEARGVSKTFSGQKALRGIDFTLLPGEIHALLGHNGSGKSTFIKILAGVHRPDAGAQITVGGATLPYASPKDSYRLGLRFVHQTPAIIPEFDAADNMALGQQYRTRFGFMIDWQRQRAAAAAALRSLDDAETLPVKGVMGDEQALVRTKLAIGRAISDLTVGGILVLDEPTASLAPHEVSLLFASLQRVVKRGVSIIYVTHRLREVYELADRITLLRDGKLLGTHRVDEMASSDLFGVLSEGKAESEQTRRLAGPSRHGAPLALRVRGLKAAGLNHVSFDLHVREVLGICGLDGSGRESLARALAGVVPADADLIETPRGATTTVDLKSMAKLGIVLAQESRASGSLVDEFTIRENLSLPSLGAMSRFGRVYGGREKRLTRDWIERLDIRPPDPETVLAKMSGGNRQKVVIARSLSRNPAVLVLDEPTAGVDVGASGSLHEEFRAAADEGVGVVLVSSDLEEVVRHTDRVLVVDGGTVVGEFEGADITESRLLKKMS